MKLEILLSCMNVSNFDIIKKSNLESNKVLIINQCDTKDENIIINSKYTMINSPSRGLSVSRNLAIQNAKGDVCLLSDDDECFISDLEEQVLKAYSLYPDADLIIFKMLNRPTKLGAKPKKLKKRELLRVSSWQISFKLESVQNKLFFDENLGSGTGNGACEENKFLLDCYKKGLKIYYVPIEIASVERVQSTWFFGYDKKYFFNRGKSTRYIYGKFFATVYAIYFLIAKHKIYKREISFFKALKYLLKGLGTKDINKKYEET